MTFVVTEACINCKHTDCVEVCPVDARVAADRAALRPAAAGRALGDGQG